MIYCLWNGICMVNLWKTICGKRGILLVTVSWAHCPALHDFLFIYFFFPMVDWLITCSPTDFWCVNLLPSLWPRYRLFCLELLLYLQIGYYFLGAAKNLMFLKTVKKSVILLGGNMFMQNSISAFIIHKIAWSCIIQQYLTEWPPAAKVALMHLF